MSQERDRSGYVYFAASEGCELVKIGFSVAPSLRLKELQVGNPRELRIVAMFPGTLAIEARVQRRFRESRVQGEWYRPTEGLLKIIAIAARGETLDTEFSEWFAKEQAA